MCNQHMRSCFLVLGAFGALAAEVGAAEPPVPMVWQYNGNTLSRKQYLKDVDFIKANTLVDVLAVATVDHVNPEDPEFCREFAEMVRYARSKGIRTILRCQPGFKGFFNASVDGADEGTYILENQDEAQGIAYEEEVTLDKDGFASVTFEARWARNKIRPLRNEIVAVWAFDKTSDGFYRKGSLVSLLDRARPVGRTARTQTVEIDAGPAFAGKTAYVLTAQYFNCCDLFGGAMARYQKRIVDSLKDAPLSGLYFDEFGWMVLDVSGIEGGKNGPWRGRFYSAAQAKWWRESRGTDLARLLFDMRYAPEGDGAVRARAINDYMDVLSRKPLEVERDVAAHERRVWGDDIFLACHSTFHNYLGADEAWHTGCDWWEVPRDFGFTDEGVDWPTRMGVLYGAKEPFLVHMFYSKRADDYYDQIVDLLPFNGREFHHAYNDDVWGKGFKGDDMEFLANIRKLDAAARRLSPFQAKSLPRMDVLVVFGMPGLFNWYPDAKARNKWDIDGSLKIGEKATELWNLGYRVALVPDRMIENGRLVLREGKFVYNGHAFERCIFLYPKYSRRAVYDFLNAAADAKLPLAVVGRADVDFEAKPAVFRGRHYDTWSPKIAEDLGAAKSAIPGGAVATDGSFVLASRGIIDGKPTDFDFRVDGVRYAGRHTGLLAYRKGEPVVATPGYELKVDIVNDGCRVQPSVASAKRPAKIDDMATYLKWKWRTDVSDPSSGLDHAALKKGIDAVLARWKGKEPWALVKTRVIDYLVDNTALGFSRFDCFPAITSWNRHDRPTSKMLWQREREVEKATAPAWFESMRKEVFASGGKCSRDYDHSSPDWDVILKLGFPGMKARVDAYPDTPFYLAEKRTAAAIMRFLDRLVAEAEKELARCGGKTREGLLEREIASLKRLRVGPPVTAFDVMQFTFVDFIVSEYYDRFQVRCFGQIDRIWRPYYERDLREGRTTEAEFREDFRHFIWQFGSIDNYWGHPLFLGGTAADGSSDYSAFSLLLLDVIDREALPTPKIQLKMAKNTPDFIWDKALRMLRNHRSVVLMGEEGMTRSMAKLGLSADECRRLIVWGCFEWLPPEGNCTSACSVNLVKPIELMLRDAKDGKLAPLATFDDFKREYYARLARVTDGTRRLLDYLESGLAETNPSLVLTLGIGHALEKGEDAFATGMRYNNTVMAEVAFASAVDSLVAVKELVYERDEGRGMRDEGRERLTLKELGEILAKDWEGHEELRLRMARSHRKWGCGNAETDALGREVLSTFTGRFVGQPNVRGGKYCCYGINSRGYLIAGKATGATPDGRKAGEELSKNMAPAIGGDAEGVTAVLKNWRTSVDPAFFPCGLVFDMMLHSSSVAGEKGLVTRRAICEEFFASGGCALNLNIQSVEELKDAQLHPEKYENLQVRVAGWNIRWNDIPKVEQDGFIRRLEAMPE